jgi:hypothetical protein
MRLRAGGIRGLRDPLYCVAFVAVKMFAFSTSDFTKLEVLFSTDRLRSYGAVLATRDTIGR